MKSIRILSSMAVAVISLFILHVSAVSAEVIPSTYSLNFDEGGHATPIGTTEFLSVTLSIDGETDEIIEQITIAYSAPPGFSISEISPPITFYPYTLGHDESIDITIAYTPQYNSFTMGQLHVQIPGDDPPNDIYIDLSGYAVAGAEICTDGFDNDMDSFIDCADDDCIGEPLCANDSDNDGIPDELDNCPNDVNPDQVDSGDVLAYWTFDEGAGTTIYDSVNDNDAELLIPADPTGDIWVPGISGKAIHYP